MLYKTLSAAVYGIDDAAGKILDPFSPIVNALAMTPLLTLRQYEKLIEEASAGLRSNPNDGVLHWLLGQAHAHPSESEGGVCGRAPELY